MAAIICMFKLNVCISQFNLMNYLQNQSEGNVEIYHIIPILKRPLYHERYWRSNHEKMQSTPPVGISSYRSL